jgi:hypothetical protein
VKGWLALGVENSVWVIYLMFSSKPGIQLQEEICILYRVGMDSKAKSLYSEIPGFQVKGLNLFSYISYNIYVNFLKLI